MRTYFPVIQYIGVYTTSVYTYVHTYVCVSW